MGLIDRARSWWGGATSAPAAATAGGLVLDLPDLPLFAPPPPEAPPVNRRAEATAATDARIARNREDLIIGAGFGLDGDENQFRRLTSGAKFQRRDLTPLQQDRMLEVTWYLYEQNPFARRLVTLMTDLILGEGIDVVAQDERIKQQLELTWTHPSNTFATRIREFHNFLSLAGELFLPVVTNPFTGRPVLGFIDPYQVKYVTPDQNNVLMPDSFTLKGDASTGGNDGKTFKVIRTNPMTGRLEGDAFFFAVNRLPNSMRGRSDLLPLADWLDLYDQYMFGEVERLNLLSSFVWDYTVMTSDEALLKKKAAEFPTPRPGMVFTHNDKESLVAQTPDLQATDRSEVAKLLRLHIAGTMGFPLSYLGDIDANHATVDAQNDVMLKTPSARQKEFGQIIRQIAQFVIESTTTSNPALFKDANTSLQVRMPEIAAKDIARVGQVLAQVASANDTAMNNGTMDRRTACTIQIALVKHLGVPDLNADQVLAGAEKEKADRQDEFDQRQSSLAAAAPRGNPRNPPPASTGLDQGLAA